MKKLLYLLSLILVLILVLPVETQARPFIGSECETVTTGGGAECYVTKTICKRYFFWIKYDTEITDLQIDCSHLRN